MGTPPLGDSRVHLVATTVLHFFASCHGAQFRIKPPPPLWVIPNANLPTRILHVTHYFGLVIFVNNPASSASLFCSRVFRGSLSQLFLHCSGILAHPCSCLFPFLDCVVRVSRSVSMRDCAFTSQPHHNFSRVGDRSHACIDKSWSSFIAPSQPEHAQIRDCCSRPRHGHHLRCGPHSRSSLLTSARARSSDRAQLALRTVSEFHEVLVLLLASPVLIFVEPQ